MRRATLDNPPRFHLEAKEGARLTLASDTGALAYIFVLEDDIVRLLVLPDGRPETAAHLGHRAGPGRRRRRRPRPPRRRRVRAARRSSSTRRTPGSWKPPASACDRPRRLPLRWQVYDGAVDRSDARDRPTQAYDFGWWDGKPRHYLAREPGEHYFGLGEKSRRAWTAPGGACACSNIDALGYDAGTSDPLYKHMPFYITRRPGAGSASACSTTPCADCAFDLGCERDNYHGLYRYFEAEHGDLDYYFIAGPALARGRRGASPG